MPDPNPSAIDIGFRLLSSVEPLLLLCRRISGPFVFATGLGIEDQVLVDLIVGSDIAVDLVTLGSGRLFPETYEPWARSETRHGLRIRASYPDTNALETLVRDKGINGFYVLRAAQSAARSTKPFVAYDPTHDLLKANPPLDRTCGQTAGFARAQDIPVNPLHHLSIGCAPRTRAVGPGEVERAGRLWWEADETPGYGLHLKDGRPVRAGA